MITIFGATGKTGSKTAEYLLSKGQRVRILGRSKDRMQSLIQKGAEPVVGDQSDDAFLAKAFTEAEAAYVLIPPKLDAENIRKYYSVMGEAVANAIRKSKIPKVVFLSSLGAEKESGTGPITGLHDVERKLQTLKNTDIVFLRAGYFMENILTSIGTLKKQNLFGNTLAPDVKVFMVAAKDIGAEAARQLLDKNLKGHVIVDLFGDRISFNEAARVIGAKISKPALTYTRFDDSDAVAAMTAMGLSNSMAQSFVEMSHAVGTGLIAPTKGDPVTPNAPTIFSQFVNETLYPAYVNA